MNIVKSRKNLYLEKAFLESRMFQVRRQIRYIEEVFGEEIMESEHSSVDDWVEKT